MAKHKKMISQTTGAEAAYWIPGELHANLLAKPPAIGVAVYGYVSAAARQSGKQPVDRIVIEVTPEQVRAYFGEAQKMARVFFDNYNQAPFDAAQEAPEDGAPPKPAEPEEEE